MRTSVCCLWMLGVLGSANWAPAAEASLAVDLKTLLVQAEAIVPTYDSLVKLPQPDDKNAFRDQNVVLSRFRGLVSNVIYLRAAAGLEESANPALKEFTKELQLPVKVERFLHEWRLTGQRPDLDSLCELIQKDEAARELSELENETDGNEGIELFLRMLKQAVHARDVVAADKLFLASIAQFGNDEDADPEYDLGIFLAEYAKLKTRESLHELQQQLGAELPDVVYEEAAIRAAESGDCRTALILHSMMKNPDETLERLDLVLDAAEQIQRIDDLIVGYNAIGDAEEDKESTIELIWFYLVRAGRFDAAIQFIAAIEREDRKLAPNIAPLRRIAEIRRFETEQCVERLRDATLDPLEKAYVLFTMAEVELRNGNAAAADEPLRNAKAIVAAIPKQTRQGVLYEEIPDLQFKLETARETPNEATIAAELNKVRFDASRLAGFIQFCRLSNNSPAADAMIRVLLKSKQFGIRFASRFLAEATSKLGDVASLNQILQSTDVDPVQNRSDYRVPARNLAIAIGVGPALEWTNSLPAPWQRGAACIGIAEAILISREPSYVPR